MKKFIYICICLIIAACKSETKSMDSSATEAEVVEMTADYDIELSDKFAVKEEDFEFKDLTSQKLQELYDLLALQNQHPEFSESIASQLESYTNDTIEIAKNIETVSIENIQLLERSFITEDSLHKIKIKYDIVLKESIIQDSIFAEIKSKKIIIDNTQRVSNKIKFTKE